MTSQNQKRHLLDLPEWELVTWLAGQGERPFRAKQIRQWLFQKRIESFGEMTDVGARLRHSLEQDFFLWSARACEHQIADDGTEKLLLVLADGGRIECVLLFDDGRRTICVSSQVGCAMGCVFCASGLDGVERNLTRGEILEQMLRLQHRLPDEERLSHIVMMGMGEPLANLDRVLSALDEARNATGLGISPRRITISTVGLPPAIRRLAEHPAGFNLAISLHAPTDELRTQLVPVNRKIGIEEILQAADDYFSSSGRRITFEYVLLAGINDSVTCARQLGKLLRSRHALLNVIPYNPVPGLPYQTPSPSAIRQFREELVNQGINVQFRQRKGNAIDAACGQLRRLRSQSSRAIAVDPDGASQATL